MHDDPKDTPLVDTEVLQRLFQPNVFGKLSVAIFDDEELFLLPFVTKMKALRYTVNMTRMKSEGLQALNRGER
jgi:hypothetical protein